MVVVFGVPSGAAPSSPALPLLRRSRLARLALATSGVASVLLGGGEPPGVAAAPGVGMGTGVPAGAAASLGAAGVAGASDMPFSFFGRLDGVAASLAAAAPERGVRWGVGAAGLPLDLAGLFADLLGVCGEEPGSGKERGRKEAGSTCERVGSHTHAHRELHIQTNPLLVKATLFETESRRSGHNERSQQG